TVPRNCESSTEPLRSSPPAIAWARATTKWPVNTTFDMETLDATNPIVNRRCIVTGHQVDPVLLLRAVVCRSRQRAYCAWMLAARVTRSPLRDVHAISPRARSDVGISTIGFNC